MSNVDKELLFKPRIAEAEITIAGLGDIRVRGLTRGQVFAAQQAKDVALIERKLLAFGMVDPPMSEADAGRWQEASPAGEIEPVVLKIQELSGLADDAAKETIKEFEADPAAEFRHVPGPETVDDGV